MENRLYTCFVAPSGRECRHMGPETLCFCKHRYKDHKTDLDEIPKGRPIKLPCRAAKCKCVSYHYIPPVNCCTTLRCQCKHLPEEHEEFGMFICKKAGCTVCTGFKSSFPCGCGSLVSQHTLMVETAYERDARRLLLGKDTYYATMG